MMLSLERLGPSTSEIERSTLGMMVSSRVSLTNPATGGGRGSAVAVSRVLGRSWICGGVTRDLNLS